MARGRSPKNKEEPKKSDNVEGFYWTDMTYTCPVRGRVTEKIKVKKLKSQETPKTIPNYELEILKEDVDDVE
jgi:hypothetical protein